MKAFLSLAYVAGLALLASCQENPAPAKPELKAEVTSSTIHLSDSATLEEVMKAPTAPDSIPTSWAQ